MDFFIDNLVKNCICDIIDNKNTIPDDKIIWFSLTRRMFLNFPAIEVFDLVYEALAEASNEEWFYKKYPEEIFKEKFVDNLIKPKKKYKEYPLLHPEIETIVSKVSIIELADEYDLKPLGKLKRICPFHEDKNPSLSLNDEMGIFHCFGCGVSGNIIKFKVLLNRINISKNED